MYMVKLTLHGDHATLLHRNFGRAD